MKFFIAVCLLAFPTILTAQDNYLDDEFVAKNCRAEWGTNYQMVEFCISQIDSGFLQFALLEMRVREQTDYFIPSFERCKNEWGQDWGMVHFCAQQQYSSLFELMETIDTLPNPTSGIVLQNCTDEWEPDVAMMAFCAEGQAESWLRLNGG